MISPDKRRRRSITWPFAPPGNTAWYPLSAQVLWRRWPLRARGLSRYRPWPPLGNPPAVAFGRPAIVPTARFRPRRGEQVYPKIGSHVLAGNMPGYPARPTVTFTARPRPRRGIVLYDPAPSPGGNGAPPINPRPILINTPRPRPRRGELVYPRHGQRIESGNMAGSPTRPVVTFTARPRSRRGMVAYQPGPPIGNPTTGPPPPNYTVHNPQLCDPPRRHRRGVVWLCRQAQGLFPGEPLRTRTQLRTVRRTAGQVIASHLAPWVRIQNTPPVPSISDQSAVRRYRPGRVIQTRWFQPLPTPLPSAPAPVHTQRLRPRRGEVAYPRLIGAALLGGSSTAVMRAQAASRRAQPRRGVVIAPRLISTGDQQRLLGPDQGIPTVRPRPRRGDVAYPRLERRAAITGGSSASVMRAQTASRPVRPRRGVVISPRGLAIPAAELSLAVQAVSQRRRPRPAAASVYLARLFPPTPGAPASPIRLRVVQQPVSGRRRPGSVQMNRGSVYGTSAANISLLPDPFAATSNAG